jgi:hypothetical protein
MPNQGKTVRRSVSLPPRVARRIRAIAKTQNTSAGRVMVNLIEEALESKEREKQRFFELAERLMNSTDPAEQKELKEGLVEMTFGV